MTWKAAKTSVFLCLLFLVVYGGTNWLASLRGGVGSFYFPWERGIPFVPWTIIPYMSIDLFFVPAPFLCRDDRELRTFARRIAVAILAAGAVFLLIPLRFSFERPHIDGWLGAIFNNFRNFDQPFNQFPSLHITLCLLLADLYLRRCHRVWCLPLAVWFVLIGLSAVLTYQHHVIDIVGGFVLAVACFHFIRDEPVQWRRPGNPHVGCYYAAGCVVLLCGCSVARPWTWLLLWPAVSLAVTAAGYFGLGAWIFAKRDGRLLLSTKLLLWPVLVGHWVSLFYYSRRCAAWDRITDHVWIGRRLTDTEARRAVADGVTAVLDLTGEFPEVRPFMGVSYHQIPILDLTAPTPDELDEAVAWISDEATRGVVYVHCKIGYSRTAAVAGAYLVKSGVAVSAEEAEAMLRGARPTIVIRPEAAAALSGYAARTVRRTHAAIK